ncbi:MAG: SlyX family protein [Nevskiaceae bacterium]|jgi:uncharacterized coiled-coil protein SlyX|nr:SlyX family protein [Nevskiaceae bacterium]
MDERLDQAEIRIAWLEQANAQLSDELHRQQREIEALRARLAALGERVAAARSEPSVYSAEDERPPHY